MKKVLTVSLLTIISLANLFFITKETITPAHKTEQYFKRVLSLTIRRLGDLQIAIASKKSNREIQDAFRWTRISYKKIEFLVEYYYPSLVRKINGPSLPFADGESSMAILEPAGFQVVEELIFSRTEKKRTVALQRQIRSLQRVFRDILKQQDPYDFQDPFIFDAVSFELYRLIALGITGFDSPVAFHSMAEAAAVIESISQEINLYLPAINDPVFTKQINGQLNAAISYLVQHGDFNRFDRLYFIKIFADPLSEKILALKKMLGLMLPDERRLLSNRAPYLFATRYYNPSGYSPNAEANATPEKILLGERLFFDPVLSVNNQRSCATCHQPAKAFTDGLAKSMSLDNINPVTRNAPTLWNAAFQPKQFYDSRAVFMEHQVFEVVHNAREMGSSLPVVLQRIRNDSLYTVLFKNAFAGSEEPVNEDHFTNAIASYLRSLVSLNSRFDQFMNGTGVNLSRDEKDGFNLFTGKAKCATCHFIPLFNGVAPPYFSEAESEVLGVPATADTILPVLDPDEGKYGLYPISILRFAFKTPTLRNIALTAPYMHNGVYKTLEEVIDFYDRGGGAGLGIAPINQTLPATRLALTAAEKKQLVAFLQTLTDTVRMEAKAGALRYVEDPDYSPN